MGIEVGFTYTLTELQKAILTAAALAGPQYTYDLIVMVQMNDIARLSYAELLKFAAGHRHVSPSGNIFTRPSVYDAFESALKTSQYTTKQVGDDIDFLRKLELLAPVEPGNTWPLWSEIELTKEGKRLAQAIAEDRIPLVRPSRREQVSIFFASAFGYDDVDRFDRLYAQEIEPSCRDLGYPAYRVDTREPFQAITTSILSGIQNSACVVADLTYSRPSVYFEAGIAHGLGIPLVLTCRRDHFRGTDERIRVHFDLEHYKISFWEVEDDKLSWPKRMRPRDDLGQLYKRDLPLPLPSKN